MSQLILYESYMNMIFRSALMHYNGMVLTEHQSLTKDDEVTHHTMRSKAETNYLGHCFYQSFDYNSMMSNDQIEIRNPLYSATSLGTHLLRDPDFSDVTLVCADNQQVAGHRAVLSSSSSFLRRLLLDSQQQSTFLYLGRVHKQEVTF